MPADGYVPLAGGRQHLQPESEVAFLARRGVAETLLATASRRAADHGTAVLQELFALGFKQHQYWSMLADDMGLRFVADLTSATLVAGPGLLATDAVRLATSVLVRMGAETVLVTAPRLAETALLRHRLAAVPALGARIVITTPATIRAFIATHRHAALRHYALNRLAGVLPRLSAGRRPACGMSGSAQLLAAVLALILAAPVATLTALGTLSTLYFVNCSVWKLAAAFRRLRRLRVEPIFDDHLPTYSVLVPLYREAAVVEDLIAHLRRIDYPALCSKSTTRSAANFDRMVALSDCRPRI